jgi:hypothetical protein
MLVERFVKKNDIFVGKLITGEELIGKIVDVSESKIKISKPMCLSLSMVETNSVNHPVVMPTPWVLGIEEDEILEINKSSFIFLTKARKEVASMYLKLTSNLIIPTSDVMKN